MTSCFYLLPVNYSCDFTGTLQSPTGSLLYNFPLVNLSYLKFNVRDFSTVSESDETQEQFGYHKFDVTKYSNTSGLISEVQFELQEE